MQDIQTMSLLESIPTVWTIPSCHMAEICEDRPTLPILVAPVQVMKYLLRNQKVAKCCE